MADKVKRTKTKYKSIYYNENTKKYDVKYNYKEYDIKSGKNRYRAKWSYNLNTLTEARAELARLQTSGVKTDDKDITLSGAYELWEIKAIGQNFSPVSIKNTANFMTMIYKVIPENTKLKDIDEDVYYKFCASIRSAGYSEETLFSLNTTFRKVINHAFKKRLITENFLLYTDNMKTKRKEDYRVISKEEYDLIDNYFKNNKCIRKNENTYKKYRFMYNLLYYCGIRIGEALALTYSDFEEFSYYKKTDEPIKIAPSSELVKNKHLQGMRVIIDKSFVSRENLLKDTKNYKKRTIPLSPSTERLYMRLKEEHLLNGGSLEDKIFTLTYSAYDTTIRKACKKLNIETCSCHDFRHTFISNLIKKNIPLTVIEKVSGDNQNTILQRYSHMFESDEVMILSALQDL
ncbi:site-specific integrase [Lachnospiraceae bacterium 45-P1]